MIGDTSGALFITGATSGSFVGAGAGSGTGAGGGVVETGDTSAGGCSLTPV
ncbi:hypothetical protein D3C73_1003420 [compost metagenome]